MNKKYFKIICILVVGLTIISIIQGFSNNKEVKAAPEFNALIDQKTIDLRPSGSVSFNDFKNNTALITLIKQKAKLDDVDLMFDRHQDDVTACKEGAKNMGNFLVSDIDADNMGTDSELKKTAMLYNTWFLQQLIYCSSLQNSGQTTIILPAGTFYFASGHRYKNETIKLDASKHDQYGTNVEKHVIKLHDNITLIGAGETKTILKPYSEKNDFYDENGLKINGGLDMFFFNEFGTTDAIPVYLKNIHFYDFTIDSEKTEGIEYDSSGKGFMINLFENGTWQNITVKNTDGTGFGVDCPLGDSWIKNSHAYGNGKKINNNPAWSGGSGFGIGTGYSDNESFSIINSTAEGNGKYGFFYEHQGRFGFDKYKATKGNFTIKNSTASSNMYNFGGLRANDITYSNITSNSGSYKQTNSTNVSTIHHLYFSDESRNVNLSNVSINGTLYQDVNQKAWYADAVTWGEKKGIIADHIIFSGNTNAVSATSKTFSVGKPISRIDTIAMIWRMMGYPGDVLSERNNNIKERFPYTKTCFSDVNSNRSFAAAVDWAATTTPYITNGISGSCKENNAEFGGTNNITRGEVVTLLYRLNGNPPVQTTVTDFKDVTDKSIWYYNAVQWAVQNKITNGIGDNTFAPNELCTYEQVISFLYRYWTQFICPGTDEQCPDINTLLNIHHNE